MEHEVLTHSRFSHADEALAAYLGDSLSEKEVLVVGSKDLARELSRRGARVTRIVRRDPQKRTRRDDATSVRVWPQGQSVDADCLIIPDVGIFGAELESRLREACTWADTIVLGVLRERGLSYEKFYELLVRLGQKPRMFGQASFRGFALVDFRDAAEADVSFDGSLVASEGLEPERYLAVSGMPLSLDGYAIVQAPTVLDAADGEDENGAGEDTREETQQPVVVREPVVAAQPKEPVQEKGSDMTAVVRDLEVRASALTSAHLQEKKQIEHDWSAEVNRLESSLAQRAQELLSAREEADRRGKLVRDLSEQLKVRVVTIEPAAVTEAIPAKVESAPAFDESAFTALAEIADLKRDLASSQSALVDLEARRIEAQLRAEMFESEAQRLRTRESTPSVKRAYGDFESQIAQLEEQLIARDREILTLSSRESATREQFRDVQVASEARVAELAAENARLSSKADSAQQRLEMMGEASADLATELASLRGEREGLALALSDARASVEALSLQAAHVVAPPVVENKIANDGSVRDAMLARALNEVAQANSKRVEALALREESQGYGLKLAELNARLDEMNAVLLRERETHEMSTREQLAESESLREECARLLRNGSQHEQDARERERMRNALLTLSAEAKALMSVGDEGWIHDPNVELRERISQLQLENDRLSRQAMPAHVVADERLKASLGDNEALRRITMTMGMELEGLRRAVLFGDADDASKRIDSLQTMLRAADQASTKLP